MNACILLICICFVSLIKGIPYEIAVYTGNVFGAGTDAKVFITLYGDKGVSPEKELDTKNTNDFERDHTDVYQLDFPDEGTLNKIKIRHDNSWFGSGWFLEKVVIKDPRGCVYTFPCHKWLDANYGDKKVSRFIETKSVCENDSKEKASICKNFRAVGISDGRIKDNQITATSSYDEKHQAAHARLNKIVRGSKGGWCSAFADDTEYLQVDFNDVTSVAGIATQGQARFDNWVTKYSLSYTTNGVDWLDYKESGKVKTFTGNKDRQSVVSHKIKPIKVKSIRIHPLAWDGLTNCMRIELYTCDKANPSKTAEGRIESQEIQSAKQVKGKKSDLLIKAVVYLKFESINGLNIIPDQTDLHNDARIVNFARLSRFSEKCGQGVDLNGGDVIFKGNRFINKPRQAVTIATWVKLYNTDGYNSIFDTIGGKNSTHSMGQYHLEVNNGSVRWFHRNEKGTVIFNVVTEVIVPPNIWTHLTSTYDVISGYAQVFVNAKFVTQKKGVGFLSQDWEVRVGIGEHKGERLLNGAVDEFYMSDKALTQYDIKKLMRNCEFEKECFSPIGMEDLKIADNQITASSVLQPHKPYYARLNLISFYDDVKKSAWCSEDDDKDPYLTIDLKTEKTLSGVAVQGASVYDSFVTSYKLCYSHNGKTYDCVKHNGTTEALLGSDDKDNIKIHWLTKFFDARYVRFYPLSWYGDNICMRVELYGCITGLLSNTIDGQNKKPNQSTAMSSKCSVSCGKGSYSQVRQCNTTNKIPQCSSRQKTYQDRAECIQPSCPECFSPMRMPRKANPRFYESIYVPQFGNHTGKINEGTIDVISMADLWCADKAHKKQYIEIDLGKSVKVTGIGTQGQISADRWVLSYRVSYSILGNIWNNYTEYNKVKEFRGNDDRQTISVRHLMHPVTARFIRIHPLAWHGKSICMRAEIFGCDHAGYVAHHLNPKSTKYTMQNSLVSTLLRNNNSEQTKTKTATKKMAKLHPQKEGTMKTAAKHSFVDSPKTETSESPLPAVLIPVTDSSRESEYQVAFNPKTSHHVKIIPILHVPNPTSFSAINSHTLPHGLGRYFSQTQATGKTSNYPEVYVQTNQIDKHLPNQESAGQNKVKEDLLGLMEALEPDTQSDTSKEAIDTNSESHNGNLRHATQSQIKVSQNLTTVQSHRPEYAKPTLKPTKPVPVAVLSPFGADDKNVSKSTAQVVKSLQETRRPLSKPKQINKQNRQNERKLSTNLAGTNFRKEFITAHHILEEQMLAKQKLRQQLTAKMYTANQRNSEYNWSVFTPCTVTCGRGVRERYRKCNAIECLAEGTEIQVLPCYNLPCKASTEWTAYSSCSVTCGSGIRTRTRTCDGIDCPIPGKEISTISCKNPDCPVLDLDFEKVDGQVILDQSGKGNNALMREEARVLPYKGICGHHVDLGYRGNLVLQEETFRQKPKYGISISCWVNLQGSSRGSHSLFSTSKVISESQVLGGYHFEIDDGRVRWFHRGHLEQVIFSVITSDTIQPNTWYHVVGTYSSNTGNAKVYIDGKLQAFTRGNGGELDEDWGYKAAIGSFEFDGRYMRGKMDDFHMYDYEISPDQIKQLLGIRCPERPKRQPHLVDQFW